VASSNNKFTYSAIGLKRGVINFQTSGMIQETLHCFNHKVRHSYKLTKVPSREEIYGMCYLMPSLAKSIIGNWWMCRFPPKFNLMRFIKQLILLIKHREDRNYWQDNGLDQMQFLTMKVPLQDRKAYYDLVGKKAPLFYQLVEWIDKKIKPSNRSSRSFRDLKYNSENGRGNAEYFPKDHPIYLKWRKENESN
jgi:hypothetical protein